MAADDTGQLGHGHPDNLGPACLDMRDMCAKERYADGTWGPSEVVLAHGGPDQTYDASASVKWSAVGFNRPNTVELLFFAPVGGNYNSTILQYARFG